MFIYILIYLLFKTLSVISRQALFPYSALHIKGAQKLPMRTYLRAELQTATQ